MSKKILFKSSQEKFFYTLIKASGMVWIGCIVSVFVIIGYVVGIRKEMFDKTPDVFVFTLSACILLGCIAFLVGFIGFIAQILNKNAQNKQSIARTLLKATLILTILPLYLLAHSLKPLQTLRSLKRLGAKAFFKFSRIKPLLIKRIVLLFFSLVTLPLWIGGYVAIGAMTKQALGYETELISIAGTGSMYPTFPKGQGKDPKALAKEIAGTSGMIRYPNGLVIKGNRFFGYQIGRGDIVVVENDKIREVTKNTYGDPSGWVKRLVGMPGDSLELREGIVYLNDQPLKEPYIAQPRSTFGEAFLDECKRIVIPKDSVFVMGDNRKGSGDSREIGFIEISAIHHVLPLKSQVGVLDQAWRDTSKDFDEASKIKLNKDTYLKLLNEKRKEVGAKELKYQSKLEVSAAKRGEVILTSNDFSFEATQSGYTMVKAMRDANYSNIVWGEAPTRGYYEAEELIDNQFQFPESKKFLLDKTFQEVGVSEFEGEINGCPTQVIVQHFAGYMPPNYEADVVASWKTNLSRLREIQPSWMSLKENANFYEKNKTDVDRINQIISTRISNISAITTRMDANQWLNVAEQGMIDQDESLYKEQETISTRLNNQ